MSWQFGILPLQIILAIFSTISLFTAPWTLAAIGNPFWKIFVQALSFSILLITLLSVGLMPYFGQKEITKEIIQKTIKSADDERTKMYKQIEELKQEIDRLKQQLENK